MKTFFVTLCLVLVSYAIAAQESTCRSRCEGEGFSSDKCERICKNFRENSSKRSRKAPALTTSAESVPASVAEISASQRAQSAKREDASTSVTAASTASATASATTLATPVKKDK